MMPTYRPTAQQELILQAALLPGEAAGAAWRRVRASVALDRLDESCRSLLPLVYRNIAHLGDGNAEMALLKEQYLRTWSENLRVYHTVLPLLQHLEEAGIQPVVLKGLALVARFYRDPGVRPMADVDVLVSPPDVPRASAIARALGWHSRHRLTPAFRRVKHAGPFDHGAGVAVDMHWRVFEEAGAARADDDFRAAAELVAFQGARLRVLSPTDQLLHVCGHAGRWNEGPAIRWVADAAAIARDGPIDWQRFLSQTVERQFIVRMRQMIRYLRQAFAVAIPAWVEAELAERPVSALERVEHRVRTRQHRLLGELPTYVFNCLRGEPHPLVAFPGYLRDAWGLESLAEVPRHALRLVLWRVRSAITGSRRPRTLSPPPGADESTHPAPRLPR